MGDFVPLYKWAKKVKERDGYKCVYCGSTDKLEAHHIVQQAKDQSKIRDLSNGVTLCRNCHTLAHNCNFTTRKWAGHRAGERYLALRKFIQERNS